MGANRITKILFFICSIALIIVMIIITLYYSYHTIICNTYHQLKDQLSFDMRFMFVGDLHDYEFDENNQDLISLIKEQHPDAIFMLGDMMNSYSDNVDIILNLIKKVCSIAPVYYALGNHELEWMDTHDEDLQGMLESAGAVVLNREYCDIELNGQQVRVGGLYDYAFSLQELELTDTENEKVQIYNFLRDFEDTDAFKIMLSHRPDSFIFGDASKVWDIDLVASGHLHGGQVVLPFLGGVYGGDQGWFPEYVHGLYEKDNMHILITSGLSTNKKPVPRWNNPPEIMVLELKPQENTTDNFE